MIDVGESAEFEPAAAASKSNEFDVFKLLKLLLRLIV